MPTLDQDYRRKLPHLRQSEATYFITWRLHPKQSDLLPPERDRIVQALKHFDGLRYYLLGWVVMNDHVHVVMQPSESHSLSKITHSWKSFTTNQLQRLHRRQGSVWQDESWDRIIRHEKELLDALEYIGGNPGKRWPEMENRDYAWVGFQTE